MKVFLLVVIVAFLFYDHYIPKRDKMIMFGCIVVSVILNIQNIVFYNMMKVENRHLLTYRIIDSWLGYILRPVMLWGLWELLRGTKRKFIRYALIGLLIVNFLIFSTCFFNDWAFGYDPVTYNWYRGSLGYTSHIIMVIMMLLFIPCLVDMYFNHKRNDFFTGLALLVVVLVITYCDTMFNQDNINDVITYEVILYFLFIHIGLEQEYTKTMIQAQKAEMMLMQIKPHFINNTLGTIQALCEIDPELAAHTTGAFAKYLRANLTAMDKPLPIPIEEEIEHTKTYLEIEMLRFPWIHAEYDIQDTDFCVPALSIQPLAENAVQHGLRKKKKGTVTIRTGHTEKGYIVQVIDDGVGFDKEHPVTAEGHGVGIRNVKYRIEEVSHGTLTVESIVGEGTTITVCIP